MTSGRQFVIIFRAEFAGEWVASHFLTAGSFKRCFTYLADGLATRRCYAYTGVSYRTLLRRLKEWIRAGVFERLWQVSVQNYDELVGLNLDVLLLDGAINIAPNGGQATGRNPTDRAKSGSKRSVLTDLIGIPIGLAIDGANRNDRVLVEATIKSSPVSIAGAILSVDAGYNGKPFQALARSHDLIPLVCLKYKESKPCLGLQLHRSPVEQLHRKHNHFRGIKMRAVRRADHWLALLHLASAIITFRATSRGVLKPM